MLTLSYKLIYCVICCTHLFLVKKYVSVKKVLNTLDSSFSMFDDKVINADNKHV